MPVSDGASGRRWICVLHLCTNGLERSGLTSQVATLSSNVSRQPVHQYGFSCAHRTVLISSQTSRDSDLTSFFLCLRGSQTSESLVMLSQCLRGSQTSESVFMLSQCLRGSQTSESVSVVMLSQCLRGSQKSANHVMLSQCLRGSQTLKRYGLPIFTRQ